MLIEKIYKKFVDSSGVITDSREIQRGCMFFSLKGPNFNGNEFAKLAIQKGASYAVVDEKKYF